VVWVGTWLRRRSVDIVTASAGLCAGEDGEMRTGVVGLVAVAIGLARQFVAI